jgi:hypothetical protein
LEFAITFAGSSATFAPTNQTFYGYIPSRGLLTTSVRTNFQRTATLLVPTPAVGYAIGFSGRCKATPVGGSLYTDYVSLQIVGAATV